MDVYRRYIKDKSYVMTSFVPKGQETLIVEGAAPAEQPAEGSRYEPDADR